MTKLDAADTYLMRFRDGLLGKAAGIKNLGNTPGDFVIAKSAFGWPLPDRLGTLIAGDAVAFWDADDPEEAELPPEITGSPRAQVYVKLSESKLTDEQDAEMDMVVRGAEFGLET